MKLSVFTNVAVMGAVLASGVVGCKHNPGRLTHLPGPLVRGPEPAPPIDNGGRQVKPGDEPKVVPINPDQQPLPDLRNWKEDRPAFAAQTVYFDLDKSIVKASEVPKVEAVATRLKAETGKGVRVEGHCDERGTEEYNRALGERRALAVREALIRLGISANLIDTVSFGEDKPAVEGHDEAAWSKNRRGQFILLSPP